MKKYRVTLTSAERNELNQLISSGKGAARKLLHARILLKADGSEGQEEWKDEAISAALDGSVSTIERVRERFVEEGLAAALVRKAPTREYKRKLNGEQEAHLVALVCSQPPEDSQRWTLKLLADKLIELNYVDTVSSETVGQVLKKMNLSLG
jgi:transposase